MNLKNIFLFLIAINPFLVLAEEVDDPDKTGGVHPIANLNGEPSAIVNNAVNAITGHFNDSQADLIIPGAEPITISRNYCSANYDDGSLCYGWDINHCGEIEIHKEKLWKKAELYENGKRGMSFFPLKTRGKKGKNLQMEIALYEYSTGVTNCSSGVIGGVTNIRNLRLAAQKKTKSRCVLIGSNGDRSHFQKKKFNNTDPAECYYHLFLDHIEKLTGNQFAYEYTSQGQVRKVKTVGQDGITLARARYKHYRYPDKERHSGLRITSSDERFVKYTFVKSQKRFSGDFQYILLQKVKRSDAPEECYDYEKGGSHHTERVVQKSLPNNHFLQIDYFRKGKNFSFGKKIKIVDSYDVRRHRVKRLKAPVGTDAVPIVTHEFIYNPNKQKPGKMYGGRTEVYDALGHRTDYVYNSDHRLTEVHKYTGKKNKHCLYSKERLYWDSTNLQKRTFRDANGSHMFTREFEYDGRHNVVRDVVCGNLTGHAGAKDECVKLFTYTDDERNLMTSQDDGKKRVCYQYYPGTNLLASELTYAADSIKMRKFYHYNVHGVLEREVTDDGCSEDEDSLTGVTQRLIKVKEIRTVMPTGLPNSEEFRCLNLESGEEELIKKVVYTHLPTGKITSKTLFDSQNVSVKKEMFAYDSHGNITKKINALGETTQYFYDVNDNLIKEAGPDSSFHKEYVYDYSDRVIAEKLIIKGRDPLITTYQYDYLGNKIASVDPYGNETAYAYDSFGRLLKTTLPAVVDADGTIVNPTIGAAYDLMSFQIKKVDPNGNVEETAFTIRGTPYLKTFPDGTQERYEYLPCGTLKSRTAPNGVTTYYQHDYQDRMTRQEVYSAGGEILETRSWEYSAFHLLREVDPEGVETLYSYHPDGQLRSKQKGEALTVFEYDTLGRKYCTKQYYSDSEYTAEIVEYDLLDRIVEERTEDASGKALRYQAYVYDCRGNKIEETTGSSTAFKDYDALNRVVKAVDALGNITMTRYDDHHCNAFGQTVLLMEITAPDGTLCLKEHDTLGRAVNVVYKNPFGALLREETTHYDLQGNKVRFTQGDADKKMISCWEYDTMNHLVATIEAVGTPEQTETRTLYNQYSQKETVIKPDGTHITHIYDAKGRLHRFVASDRSFDYQYTYDANDNPVEVRDLLHGTSTIKEYDATGRLTYERLGNGLALNYQYDRQGRPIEVVLPDGTGVAYQYDAAQLLSVVRLGEEGEEQYRHVYTEFDLSGHPLAMILPGKAGKISSAFDRLGRVIDAVSAHIHEELQYDVVGNLTGRTITLDQQEHKKSYQYDPLKRLTHEGEDVYKYDALHNRVAKNGLDIQLNHLNQVIDDGSNTYAYDPNGNMTEMQGARGDYRYHYDAMDRLVRVEAGDVAVSYRYDEMNRRLEKRVESAGNVTVNQYLYQGQNEVGMTDAEGRICQLRLLGVGKGAEIGASIAMEIEEELFVPLSDQQGNIVALLDPETGGVVETYHYTAFGEQEEKGGISPWRFSGKRKDSETGFTYFGRRYYAPWLGKWATPDPAGHEGGPNLYVYVDNAPLTKFDLYGLMPYQSPMMYYHRPYFFRHSLSCHLGSAVGGALRLLGDHLIPLPLVRDIPSCLGELVMRGNLDYHTRSDRQTHSYIHQIYGSRQLKNASCSFTGGVLNKSEEFHQACHEISDSCGNIPIISVYNASHGFLTDILETIAQKLVSNCRNS